MPSKVAAAVGSDGILSGEGARVISTAAAHGHLNSSISDFGLERAGISWVMPKLSAEIKGWHCCCVE
jgi:hypothetical protein